MTISALLIFMVISQIALAGYLLYSFNDVEREARKRNAAMKAHFEAALADLEKRLRNDTTPRTRPVSIGGGG
jgi:hypothetical protein